MRKIELFVMVFAMVVIFAKVSWAGEIDDLRKEMQALRQDYESKIQTLEKQVGVLVNERKEGTVHLEKTKGKGPLDVDYVGRYDGPFEKGGLLVRDHSGFGNVSVGGYMDIELENFQNRDSAFDQHRWILNVGAELGERLRFYSEYEIEHGGPDASGGGEAKVEQAWVD